MGLLRYKIQLKCIGLSTHTQESGVCGSRTLSCTLENHECVWHDSFQTRICVTQLNIRTNENWCVWFSKTVMHSRESWMCVTWLILHTNTCDMTHSKHEYVWHNSIHARIRVTTQNNVYMQKVTYICEKRPTYPCVPWVVCDTTQHTHEDVCDMTHSTHDYQHHPQHSDSFLPCTCHDMPRETHGYVGHFSHIYVTFYIYTSLFTCIRHFPHTYDSRNTLTLIYMTWLMTRTNMCDMTHCTHGYVCNMTHDTHEYVCVMP